MDRHLSPPEVAELLGVKLKTLANWRCDPKGPGPRFRRIGNRIQYPSALFDAWLEANLHTSTADYPNPAPAPATPPPATVEDLDATIDDLVRQLAEAQTERAKRLAGAPAKSPRGPPPKPPGPRKRR